MRRKRLSRARRRKRWLWAAGSLIAVALLAVWLVNIIAQFMAARAFGPELTSLCAGYQSVAELSDAVPDGRLVVLQSSGKRIHPRHNKLPDERRADSADEADYVACLRPSSYTVEVCTYTAGGRVKRIRYGYEMLFVDPELGTPVALETVYGPYPDRCPESKGTSLFTETIKGEKPGFEAFASLFEGESSDSQPPTLRPEPTQEAPVRPEPTRAEVKEVRPKAETIVPEPTRIEVEGKEATQPIVTPGSQPPETAVLAGSPSLWSGPDHEGEHMGIILKEGERIEILATTKEWTQVRWVSPEGTEVIGWVLSQFVGKP